MQHSNISQPFATRMRPRTLAEFVGQQHLLGDKKPLSQALEHGQIHSMIFWGPPGTGKTTLAGLIAERTDAVFESLSAVFSGVKDIRAAMERAQIRRHEQQQDTILFIDEVHRFNKSQQDAFLPFIENGTITFIGATTENPSFSLNNALLSRARIYVLKSIDISAMEKLLSRAEARLSAQCYQQRLMITAAQLSLIAKAADGDARQGLTLLEIAAELAEEDEEGRGFFIKEAVLGDVLSGGVRRFDKGGDAFYDLISALHKSVRGSAPDAALYWLARMFDGGVDPRYVARRVVRMASEDIGNADPRALTLALNAWQTQERLGSPEGELAIAQAVVYLAVAPKSNAVYAAFKAAMKDVKRYGSLEVPVHLRNAPTVLMKQLDYGKNYRYVHDEVDAYAAGENYFPEAMGSCHYYRPVERGLEIKIAEKLARLARLDEKARAVKRACAGADNIRNKKNAST